MNEWELWVWFLKDNPFYKWMFIAGMTMLVLGVLWEILVSLKNDNKIKIFVRNFIVSGIDYILEVIGYDGNENAVRNSDERIESRNRKSDIQSK